MIKFTIKKSILALCAALIAGTAFAATEKMTVRERVESGKKVSVHKVIKSDDPALIYEVPPSLLATPRMIKPTLSRFQSVLLTFLITEPLPS